MAAEMVPALVNLGPGPDLGGNGAVQGLCLDLGEFDVHAAEGADDGREAVEIHLNIALYIHAEHGRNDALGEG